MERLAIRIPPGSAHVASVRAFVGAVGRRLGCSEETIDDLRLVATEACAQAIEERVADDGVEVRTLSDDHRLLLEIDPSGSFERPPDEARRIRGKVDASSVDRGPVPRRRVRSGARGAPYLGAGHSELIRPSALVPRIGLCPRGNPPEATTEAMIDVDRILEKEMG